MLKQYKGNLLIMFSAVMFGCMPLVAKTIYQNGGNPITLTLMRNVLSLPFLFILMKREQQRNADVLHPLPFGKMALLALGFSSTPLLLFCSYNYISSGMATTIHFVYPIFVVVCCVFVFRQPPNAIKIICTLLCTVGILLFYEPGEQGSLLGVLLAFASGITYAFYIVYLNKSGLTQLPTFTLAFWVSMLSGGAVAVMGAATRQISLGMTPLGWLMSFVFAIAIAIFASVAFQVGVKIVGPQRASILSTLEPITSIVIGVLLFSEPFGFKTAVGVVFILASVLTLTLFDKENAAPCEKETLPSEE